MLFHIDTSRLNIFKKIGLLLIYPACLFFIVCPTFAQEILTPEGNPQVAPPMRADSGGTDHISALGSCTSSGSAGCKEADTLPAIFSDIFIPQGDPAQTLEGMLIGATGIAVDFDGNVYVADTQNHVVRKYSPAGVPLTVFGRETQPGLTDGSPLDVRFILPWRLATDKDGHILVVDQNSLVYQNNPNRIRRINVNTLQTTTVADLSTAVDATQAYDVLTGFIGNLGILSNLVIGDIAAHPNGDLFVSATDLIARIGQYLIRISRNGTVKQVIAHTSLTPNQNQHERTGPRGLAIDRQGNVFTAFTDRVTLSGIPEDSIYRFPAGTTTGVSQHYIPDGVVRAMGAGLGNQLYVFLPDPTGLIAVISTVVPRSTLGYLQPVTFPSGAQVQDVAVDRQGNVYAVNYHLEQAGSATAYPAKVDRFRNVDTSIGQINGDSSSPAVSITNPTADQLINAPVTVRVTATDNSGQVQVQFRLDDKPFGRLLLGPPFELTLDPSLIYSGNHVLYAVAHDPAGNATVSNPVRFRSEGGLANVNGEIFLSHRDLPGAPFGIATDSQNNVYVTSDTGQITKFDPQGRMLAVFKLPPNSTPFTQLAGMGKEYSGNLLFLDRDPSSLPPGTPRVHRLNTVSGTVTTLGILSKTIGINARLVLNLDTGQFEDMTAPVALLCNFTPLDCYYVPEKGVDIAGSPDGSIIVGVEGQILPQAGNSNEPYLVRINGYNNSVLARSSTFLGGRGVAVDSNGQIFTVFPRTFGSNAFDSLTRFPSNFPSQPYQPPQPLFNFPFWFRAKGMDIDRSGRVYITLTSDISVNGGISAFAGGQTNTLLEAIDKQILAQPHDVAVDNRGNIYVTSTEIRFYGNNVYQVSRVTRFGEIFTGQSVLDTDGDGILDDGDGSGIVGDKYCLGGQTTSCDDNCQFNKNANQSDSDNDGVGDVCDPDNQCKVGVDTDEDGISDCDELQIYRTNPNVADTDGDGLGDGVEIGIFGFDADPATTTDPLKRDTDGDGRLDGNNGIDPCEDCNNNGRMDTGESDSSVREGFVALVEGFNLFSYPGTVPPQYATCTNLLTALGTTNQIDSLSHFNPTSQRFEECTAGNNFAITIGEAYVVKMKVAGEVALPAQPVCPSLNLATGLNLVGHPIPQANLTCFGLLNGFGANTVAVIQRFNAIAGRFEACTWDQGGQAAGVDFSIVPGEGYLVHTLAGSTETLPGCSH